MRKPRQRKRWGHKWLLLCRIEIFIWSTHFGSPLATAQALCNLGGSHITRPPNKPLLLVLLYSMGLRVGVVERRGRRESLVKAQSFAPPVATDTAQEPDVSLGETALLLTSQSAFHLSWGGVQMPYFSMQPSSLGDRGPIRLAVPSPE